MALRIGGSRPAPPVEEELPIEEMPMEELPEEEEVPVEEPMAEEPMPEEAGGTVDPVIAGYKGPEKGPFQCANCIHYLDGACEIVAGPVEDEGVCNLFTGPEVEEEMPMEEELPEEALPTEEPVEEEEAEEGY